MLVLDAVLVAGLAVWMTVAVRDNWVHPALNEAAVAVVVRMEAMAQEYPEDFAHVAHRRVEDVRIIGALFQLIRGAETLAAAALVLSVLMLLLAAGGAVAPGVATGVALTSVAGFVSIWAGFVIGGNWFCYWYCHQWAQANHFSFLVWGLLVFIALLN